MLRIGITEYDEIRLQGEATYPDEACGILLGSFSHDVRTVRSIVRCANASAKSVRNTYAIAPAELVRAQREARERDLEIVGFYHSHPDHPAQWSPTDLEQAHWIGCSYVITSVEHGKACATKSFVLSGKLEEDKAFIPEELVVDEKAA